MVQLVLHMRNPEENKRKEPSECYPSHVQSVSLQATPAQQY